MEMPVIFLTTGEMLSMCWMFKVEITSMFAANSACTSSYRSRFLLPGILVCASLGYRFQAPREPRHSKSNDSDD
jgi:hypothetical protein